MAARKKTARDVNQLASAIVALATGTSPVRSTSKRSAKAAAESKPRKRLKFVAN